MKKIIALLLLAALLLTGCGAGKSGNDSSAVNTDTADATDTNGAYVDQSVFSANEDFENKVMAICKEHGIGYSYHMYDYNRPGLSDPDVVARVVTCNTIDGRRDYLCEIKTEYYEDTKFAREAYDLQREATEIIQPLSDWYTMMDDDVTLCIKSDLYKSLMYCRYYDHYVVYIVDGEYCDVTTEIMYEIESLIEGF
jgi:uncharacterized protein YcfL